VKGTMVQRLLLPILAREQLNDWALKIVTRDVWRHGCQEVDALIARPPFLRLTICETDTHLCYGLCVSVHVRSR
jgi:hypothetical protein